MTVTRMTSRRARCSRPIHSCALSTAPRYQMNPAAYVVLGVDVCACADEELGNVGVVGERSSCVERSGARLEGEPGRERVSAHPVV